MSQLWIKLLFLHWGHDFVWMMIVSKMFRNKYKSHNKIIASIWADLLSMWGNSDICLQDCSPIAFVLDHLLSLRERALIDLDVASMARMLIAALASCNHSPEVQVALVSEVKNITFYKIAYLVICYI